MFPNRGSPLRVLMGETKRGYTETHTHTHTKRSLVKGASGSAIAVAVWFSVLKIRVWQKTSLPYTSPNICNGKTKGLALLSLNRLINDFSLQFSF